MGGSRNKMRKVGGDAGMETKKREDSKGSLAI